MGGTRSTGEKNWVERSRQKKGVWGVQPAREEAILAEVISALLSAHYLIWGQLAPVRVTGVAQAEKLCLGQPRWSLTRSVPGLPGTGHCPGQDQAPGSCRQPLPPVSPGLRARQAGPGAAAGPADAAISADTVWRVPASPPGDGGFNPPPESSPNTFGARRNAARPRGRGRGAGCRLQASFSPLPWQLRRERAYRLPETLERQRIPAFPRKACLDHLIYPRYSYVLLLAAIAKRHVLESEPIPEGRGPFISDFGRHEALQRNPA